MEQYSQLATKHNVIISLSLYGDDTLYFKQEMMLMDFLHSVKIFNVVSNECLLWFSEGNTW